MTTTPSTVSGLNLGNATLTSPMQRRYRNNRRSTLSGEALNAIHLTNEINGEDGTQMPLPPQAARNLFGTAQGPVPPQAAQAAPASTTPIVNVPPGRTITIDGREMILDSSPADRDTYVVPRLWDKLKREDLDCEQRQIFVKAATGFVLAKGNKLAVLSTKQDDDGILKHCHNLRTQLKALEDHAINHDIVDVFTIVSAHDITQSGAVHANPDGGPRVYNLFTDYPRLHLSEVAASNAWYNTWLIGQQPYVKENMQLTFELLRHNTEETLWSKCLEKYEEFHPIQQGGPLMLHLILERIQTSSESAVEFLKGKILSIKIREIEGENVDTVVSLIKAAHQALLSASTPTRSYVPDDLPLKVMEIFQTSSHHEFNKVFADEVSEARRQADKYGGVPNWNTISQTLNQASSTYRRLKLSGEWDTPKKNSPAFAAQETRPPRDNTRPRAPPKCWNCGEEGHTVPTCPKPSNPETIKKNKQAFLDARRISRSRNWPRTKTAKDGSSLVLNAQGYYVHATSKKKRAQKKDTSSKDTSSKETSSKLAAAIKSSFGTFIAKLDATPPSGSSPPPESPSTLAAHLTSLRDTLLNDLKEE